MNNKDPRRQKRITQMQQIFAFSISPKSLIKDENFIKLFQQHKAKIDQLISSAAVQWPIEQMNNLDLAILRTIILEYLLKKTPVKVLINEGIEIAKEFGTQSSPKFVNGVLGKILLDS